MTAGRWWVKSYARWIARVQAVQGQLNLFFTAISGVSLGSGALKYFGAPTWVVVLFLLVTVAGIVGYVYAYSEYGVWNQKNRDQNDMGNNFSGPDMLMNATQFGVSAFSAVHKRKPNPAERDMIEESVREQWQEYRDGISVDDATVTDGGSE